MYNELIIPSIPNSSIHISGIAHPTKSDSICGLHLHNELEIFKTMEGLTEFYINNEEYEVCCGDIIFINSLVPHSSTIYKNSSAFFLQFPLNIDSQRSPLSRFINHGNKDVVVFKANTPANIMLSACLESILNEYNTQAKSYDMFIKSYVYNILAILYRQNIANSPEALLNKKNIIKITPVLEYIDAHLNESLSLEFLASILNITPYYLCRLFKKAINTSLVQYLNFVRVCKAEKMLLSTDKSISEISYETGFSSVSYFNRTFKKYNSCAPSMYRKIKYKSGI